MGRTCSIEGCTNAYHARGWCKTHYARWLRRNRSAERKQVVSRLRDDGMVHCGCCKAWLPPESFTPRVVARGIPLDGWCRACCTRKQREWLWRKVERDPGYYDRKMALASHKRGEARRQAREKRERAEARDERRALFAAARSWLQQRGLRDSEIRVLARLSNDAWQAWCDGRGRQHDVADRMVAVMRAAGDLPTWPDRKRGEAHPWVPVLRARLAQLEAA